jgi:U3 small nucleolar RNA-associated protein 5
MILSQVESRASTTPALLTSSMVRMEKTRGDGVLKRYIEGDTDSDGEVKMDMGAEVDSGDEGSIEDIELGGDSESDDEEDEDLSDRDDGSLTKFVDDEAAEDFSEGVDDDESE